MFESGYFGLFRGFIASFCEENNYERAKSGYGTFCLGFKKSYLQKYLADNLDLMFGHVVYD